MSQNLDDLVVRLEVVLRDNDIGAPEYIEITNELVELTIDDRQLFLQKLDSREGGTVLMDKVCELFELCAEMEEMPAPEPFDPSTAEETCLAGDPTTDPDDEA
jgi:hypothetical protein